MNVDKPLLLDLFCCAGGASTGYYRAGFNVIGVDLQPQPNYPFPFHQGDAIEVLDTLLSGGSIEFGSYWPHRILLSDVDAFAASPPCQGYSITKSINPNADKYPRLIADVRARFNEAGKPYVIENVEGAKRDMIAPVTLCGSQFGKRMIRNGHEVYLRRHRLFESNVLLPEAGPHNHSGRAWPVFGHGPGGKKVPAELKGKGSIEVARFLMGIDWTTRHELAESIPPAYTQYLGQYIIAAIDTNRWAA